jgi:meso-butanediol dehydrogenase / (S,S)-butanediol dehydrogenase / diacetyl reductase
MKKIAVVTGASGGIGFATCIELGKAGYAIMLCDRNEERGLENVKALADMGIEAELYVMNVTDEETVNLQIKAIGEKHGKIDVLVNAAGGLGGRSRFEEMTTEFYRSVMALNLDSVFFLSRAAIPYLKQGENPSIINFTSIAGWNAGGPGAGVYGTSKAAVTTFTRALAKDLAEYNIRVNAVSPGTIDTPFHQATKENNPALFESWKNGIVMKRFGTSEEVASVVEFLASSKASYLTGEVIQINGGQAFL